MNLLEEDGFNILRFTHKNAINKFGEVINELNQYLESINETSRKA